MTRRFSPRLKFIAITVDELFLVPLVIFLVYYFAPEYLWDVTILAIACAAVFVVVKYYLVYPSLLDTASYELYDMKGMTGVVTETVTPKHGKIRVGVELWDARCEVGEIAQGSEVRVLSMQNLTLNVAPINT